MLGFHELFVDADVFNAPPSTRFTAARGSRNWSLITRELSGLSSFVKRSSGKRQRALGDLKLQFRR